MKRNCTLVTISLKVLETSLRRRKAQFQDIFQITAQKFPGHVRSFQEKPFKLMMGNYDQLRIGAEYFNRTEFNFVCIDSSGKLWGERQRKSDPKKLNTGLVLPPFEKSETPFSIFEQISESNKTIDFIMFLKYAWHYMRLVMNNQNVRYPCIIIREEFNQFFYSMLYKMIKAYHTIPYHPTNTNPNYLKK